MSDDAPADDSGFDKEAEREKLREKFARDDQKRESTRRMSELLLKGATMTNTHCDNCGSPIFRQNGQEFCPQCDDGGGDQTTGSAERKAVSDTTAAGDAVDVDIDDDAPGSVPDPQGQQSQQPRSQQNAPSATQSGTPDGTPTPTDAPSTQPSATTPANGHATDTGAANAAATPTPPAAGGDDLPAARDALARALRRHAEAGAEASDPHTANAHLEAAHEAAEALAALRR